jgi:RHS repeat-associated protein
VKSTRAAAAPSPSPGPLLARSSRCARARATSTYIFDALGSVIALTDGSGAIAASYTYDPSGTTLTASGAEASVNPFRFASGYYDSATGLLKFGARYYDSSLGRWTQRDSIAGSIANPNAMDRYVYAGDSPVNLTDVSGLSFSSFQFVGCMISAAAAGAGLFTILTLSGGLAFPILFLGTFTAELDVVGSSALFANFCTPFGPFLT